MLLACGNWALSNQRASFCDIRTIWGLGGLQPKLWVRAAMVDGTCIVMEPEIIIQSLGNVNELNKFTWKKSLARGLVFKLCSVSVICQTPRTALEKRHGALCDPALLPRKHLVFRTRLVPCLPSFVARCPKMLRPAHLQLHRPVCEMSLGVKHLVITVSVGCVVLLLCWFVMRCVVFIYILLFLLLQRVVVLRCIMCSHLLCRGLVLLTHIRTKFFYAFIMHACIVSFCLHAWGVVDMCASARACVHVCALLILRAPVGKLFAPHRWSTRHQWSTFLLKI